MPTAKKWVILERVFPPTISRMNDLVMNEPETATVLHFMGHCVSKNNARALVLEPSDTGNLDFANANSLTIPNNLRLAFLSACDTRNIAQVLLKRGVPYTIGSHCPIPNDLAALFLAITRGVTVGRRDRTLNSMRTFPRSCSPIYGKIVSNAAPTSLRSSAKTILTTIQHTKKPP